jgi:hypothetical protein
VARTVRGSARTAGDRVTIERALIKAKSPCLSIGLGRGSKLSFLLILLL